MSYNDLKGLKISVDDNGIAMVTMQYFGDDYETREHQHRELGQIWRRLDADDMVRAVVITGPGNGEFYASGRSPRTPAATNIDQLWARLRLWEHEVNRIVYELIDCRKPIVSAINGTASGAGLTVALFADISIAAEDAMLFDPHVMLGLAAGDGALALWPILTGLAKAKRYLLTSDPLEGREAERIGLVSVAVPADEVLSTAIEYGQKLAAGPATAIAFNKKALNQWLRLARILSHDYSFALEGLSELSGERGGAPYGGSPTS
jgi:enoyl-CoA hydratase